MSMILKNNKIHTRF